MTQKQITQEQQELIDIYEDSQYKTDCRLQLKAWLEKTCAIRLFWNNADAYDAGVDEGLIDTRRITE